MLRGAALMLLALGYVLLCFHKQSPSPDSRLLLTRMLAAVGVSGLVAVEGMNLFFLTKYHFRRSHYAVVPATLAVFLAGGVLAFPEILFSAALPAMVPGAVGAGFGLGWLAGFFLQGRLLLAPGAYAVYMQRRHDFRKVMLVFGRFPLVFFMAMLVFTQLLAWITAFSAGYGWHDFDFANGHGGLPQGFGYNLARVWLTWFCILGVLYPLCKWFGRAER